jgi:2-polyprenyl-3-methyl-5-hydroxy-6-metoxy-1,4-benzoquinol methylase
MRIRKIVTRSINNFFKLFGFELVRYEKEKKWHVEDPILHNSKDAINEFYSREDFLDTYIGRTRLEFYNIIADLIKSMNIDLSNKTVVDVGCGTGHLLHFIHEKLGFNKGTGLEYSSEAIKMAKRLFPTFEFFEYDVSSPWKERYDFVVCTEVLEHLLDPDNALKNILNMMTEKGKVLITVPNGRTDTFGGHINFWSPESWEVFVKKNAKSFDIKTGMIQNDGANFAVIERS